MSPALATIARARALAVVLLVSLAAPTVLAQDGPPRADVTDFFAGLRADLLTCAVGWHGSIDVEVTFSSDGAVTGVATTGDGAPESVLACVRSVVRSGHVPAFTGPTATVERSIRL